MNISAAIGLVGAAISQWRRLRRERKLAELAEQIEEIRLMTSECDMQREYYQGREWEHNGRSTIKDKLPSGGK